MNKLLTFMGGKFKFSAQDRDLEYFFGEVKIFKYLLTLSPPLTCLCIVWSRRWDQEQNPFSVKHFKGDAAENCN